MWDCLNNSSPYSPPPLVSLQQEIRVVRKAQLREAHAVQKEMDNVLGRSKIYTGSRPAFSFSSHLLSYRSQAYKCI